MDYGAREGSLTALLANLRALKWIIGGFLVVSLVLAWQIEKRGHAKAKTRIVELTVKLDELAKRSAESQKQTGQIITRYRTEVLPRVEREVRRVETAPLGKNCETPAEIMGADL